MTAWPYDVSSFNKLNETDNALVLHEWHDAIIRENWQSLTPEEVEWVEQWRGRTYRHYNPIDRGTDVKPPKYVNESKQISAIINDL